MILLPLQSGVESAKIRILHLIHHALRTLDENPPQRITAFPRDGAFGTAVTGFSDHGVEASVTDKLFGPVEPVSLTDFASDQDRGVEIHTRNRRQELCLFDNLIERLDLLGERLDECQERLQQCSTYPREIEFLRLERFSSLEAERIPVLRDSLLVEK